MLPIPVAVDTAAQLNANALAFALAVTFAASTAFMSPVGYQTNLFVYGPGGYDFSDYIRVGGPLQAILAVVTTLGIAAFWGSNGCCNEYPSPCDNVCMLARGVGCLRKRALTVTGFRSP